MIRSAVSAALAFAFAGLSPLYAADLNSSNGLADLEERVAELEATTARKGNRRVSVSIYGEINKGILWVSGAGATHHEVIENATSPTRFGFVGEAKLDKGWKAGYKLEIGVNDRPVPFVEDQLKVRHSFWWLESPMGKLSVGLTSMATDGIAALTVANTDVAAKMLSLQPISSAFLLGLDLPFNNLRRNVVRYDTPVAGGFMVSASLANGDTPFGFGSNPNEVWDVALRYAGEFGGFRALAGIGLSQQDNNISLLFGLPGLGRERVISGSASMMHLASGLFVNVAGGDVTAEQILGGADYRTYHAQAGWQKNVFGFGSTTLFGEYAKMDIKGTSVSPNMMGAGMVQSIDAAAMDLYLAARRYNFDMGGSDVTTVMAGARVRF